MTMRYIIRRPKAEDLAEIRAKVADLETRLGAAAENLRATIPLPLNALRQIHYLFQTRKTANGWIWVCPTIEIVAENEKGLFALTQMLNVPRPAHLAHL